MRRFLLKSALFAAVAIAAFRFDAAIATNLEDGAVVSGHLTASNPPTVAPPTGTNCTMVAGSSDMAGECAATATSAVQVTFGKAFAIRPFCTITDSVTATGINLAAGPSTTGFTMGTTASGDKIRWVCIGQVGN